MTTVAAGPMDEPLETEPIPDAATEVPAAADEAAADEATAVPAAAAADAEEAELPAKPPPPDKGAMVTLSQLFGGLIPQPGMGGIVFVQASDWPACLTQAFMATPSAVADGEDEKESASAAPAAAETTKPLTSVSIALANAMIAIAPPPPAYLLAPKAKSPPQADGGRGRGRGRGSRGGGRSRGRGQATGWSGLATPLGNPLVHPQSSALQPSLLYPAGQVAPDGSAMAAASGGGLVTANSQPLPMAHASAGPMDDDGGHGGGGPSKTSARALLAQHKVQIPDDLTKLQPIPTRRTKSGWVGVYPARKGRWQAQVNHRSIGGYSTAWEAGVAVAAHLVVMARAEEQAEIARAEGREPPDADALAAAAAAASAAAVQAMSAPTVPVVVAATEASSSSSGALPLAVATVAEGAVVTAVTSAVPVGEAAEAESTAVTAVAVVAASDAPAAEPAGTAAADGAAADWAAAEEAAGASAAMATADAPQSAPDDEEPEPAPKKRNMRQRE